MEMVKVKECDVNECSYNSRHMCHTLAVTIGHDQHHPMCDTFCQSESKGGDEETIAGVGACKMSSCEYNESLECCASSVMVGHQRDEVDCLTYKRR